jgi:hypothetical protein
MNDNIRARKPGEVRSGILVEGFQQSSLSRPSAAAETKSMKV